MACMVGVDFGFNVNVKWYIKVLYEVIYTCSFVFIHGPWQSVFIDILNVFLFLRPSTKYYLYLNEFYKKLMQSNAILFLTKGRGIQKTKTAPININHKMR